MTKKRIIKAFCSIAAATSIVCLMGACDNIWYQLLWMLTWMSVLVASSAVMIKYNLLDNE